MKRYSTVLYGTSKGITTAASMLYKMSSAKISVTVVGTQTRVTLHLAIDIDSINLILSRSITDKGVSALGHRSVLGPGIAG